MKFSVCIINWNWLEVLKPTIENLRLERNTVDLEIIVLDNGSVDGSREWLQEQTDFKVILNEENLGASIGRNQLIRAAQGDYILMLDSDIIYINGSAEYLLTRMLSLDTYAMCVGFSPLYFQNNINEYRPSLPSLNEPLYKHYIEFASYALTQYGLFKKQVFQDVMFDEYFKAGWGSEDDDFYLRMLEFGYDVYQVRGNYYHAKLTDKWHKCHDQETMDYGKRVGYFRRKWNWGNVKSKIVIMWATIRPDMMVETYKKWYNRCHNKAALEWQIAVYTHAQKQEIDTHEFENCTVTVINDKRGYNHAITKLTTVYEGGDDDILLLLSDDFDCPENWDLYLFSRFNEWDGALFLNDGYQNVSVKVSDYNAITLACMNYKTLKKLNKIVFNPCYNHFWSDAEAFQNLYQLGLLEDRRDVDNVVFQHMHYCTGRRVKDSIDEMYYSTIDLDKQSFFERMKLPIEERLKLNDEKNSNR